MQSYSSVKFKPTFSRKLSDDGGWEARKDSTK